MPAASGGTNWAPPSFSPQTGLFYVGSTENYSLLFLTDTDEKPEGFAGKENNLWSRASIKALDYRTGKVKWMHEFPGIGGGNMGVLSTAGNLVFTGDQYTTSSPSTPHRLYPLALPLRWSSGNGPMSYELDGKQYIAVGAGDSIYTFALNVRPLRQMQRPEMGPSFCLRSTQQPNKLADQASYCYRLQPGAQMNIPFRSIRIGAHAALLALLAVPLTAQTTNQLTAKNVAIAQTTYKGRGAVQIKAAPAAANALPMPDQRQPVS